MKATIASGQSLSGVVPLAINHETLVGIQMPPAWTTADLSFQAAYDDDATFVDLYDVAGVEVTAKAAASRYIPVDPADFRGVLFLKIRSGTAATPVNQAADRELILITARL